jgi:predicted transcriptional regulator
MPTQRSSKTSKAASKLSSGDLALLRFVSEQGTAPVDFLARHVGEPVAKTRTRLRRLARGGWLVLDEFETERYPWVRLRAQAHKLGLRSLRTVPNPTGFNHRRGVIEVQRVLAARHSKGHWVSEGEIIAREGFRDDRPDGELEVGGKCWAIEVELSRKSAPQVRRHVAGLLKRYDRVLYFCAPHVLALIKRIADELPAGRLEACEVEQERWLLPPQHRRAAKLERRISAPERKLLALITEEGLVAIDQLARLLGREVKELRAELDRLQRDGLLEQGLRFRGSSGWVWCTYRGTRLSGTGIAALYRVGSARLQRRRSFMAVRIELTGGRRQGRWLTRRMLGKGAKRGMPIDMAVWEYRGHHSAIVLSLDRPIHGPSTVPMIDRLRRDYDEVLWYCSGISLPRARRFVIDRGLENVEVRRLPVE